VCGIDVYHAEAEAWGAKVMPSTGGVAPALGDPPLSDPCAILGLPALDAERDGRLPLLLDAAARLSDVFPSAEVQVPLAGPVSIAMGLLGFETVLMEFAEKARGCAGPLIFSHGTRRPFAAKCSLLDFGPPFYESGAAPPLVPPQYLDRSLRRHCG